MYLKKLSDVNYSMFNLVGGKNASLGEMLQISEKLGIRIPDGFVLTTLVYDEYIQENNISQLIEKEMNIRDNDDYLSNLTKLSREIQEKFMEGKFNNKRSLEILNSYEILSKYYNLKKADVAVRSSATTEDLPNASFAGQQDTYLNVTGYDSLIFYIKKCMASLFNVRAMNYRKNLNITFKQIKISVGVQKMVRSDLGSAGVAFSLDPESGNKKVIVINSAYGLGELVVNGQSVPDEFIVMKELLDNYKPIIDKKLGQKEGKLVYANRDGIELKLLSSREKNNYSLNDFQVLELAKWIVKLEKYYSEKTNRYHPVDIEWAYDGELDQMFIVQCRPETIHSNKNHNILESYKLNNIETLQDKKLLEGIAVGDSVGCGKVHIVPELLDDLSKIHFDKGDVLVTTITDPDWEPLMKKASVIITEKGGRTCHAAIVARELGVPALVGCKNAISKLEEIDTITLDCSNGEKGIVYEGKIKFEKIITDLSKLPEPPVKIMMNLASPEQAFKCSNIPNSGVGLAREEFIINNYIKVHPLALLQPEKITDKHILEKIKKISKGYSSGEEYFIKKLTYGLSRIAAAFYPKDVIIRFSDFKSNEYRNLLGGKYFEPHEENPMIGWRGASRYYSLEYEQAFGMECKAIQKVRELKGFKNVIVMLPFCRTVEECKLVLQTMEKYGLKRGVNGLQVYLMCEIPSNVILAEEFCKYVDGFSIGSNDLTQLILGLDRDSELVQHLYDERNPAVKIMISRAIKVCKKNNVKIGICGQGPSDFPDFAQFLVEEGIDSISLTADSIVKTIEQLDYN